MAASPDRNKDVISKAFARLKRSEERTVHEGMVRLAQAGMAFLVEAHDYFRDGLHHPEEDDTMGYAVSHDGVIIESGSFHGGGDDLPGDAMNKARRILSGTNGWRAVILSEMEGWYRVDWEMDFLHASADEVKSNFHKFFKPV